VDGITPNITQTPVATIYGNQITPADTSPNKPTTSVSGRTTYSNAVPQYTQFGSGLTLTPATTGLTISIVFEFDGGPYYTETFFYLGGNGNYAISARLGINSSFDIVAIQAWDSTGARFMSSGNGSIPIISGWTPGTKYYWTFTILPVSSTQATSTQYRNGVQYDQTTASSAATALGNGTYTTCSIAQATGYQGSQRPANITVYDFFVLNAVLSASQVSTLYQKQLTNSNYQIAPPAALTGTPLFTQLSTSATSSAVGAFSLRAVNGVTTRAVAVQVHPVVAYPPASLTSNTTTLSAQTYGNGTYTTVASSYNAGGGIYEAWRAFTTGTNWWRPADANYNGTTGLYTGTAQVTVSGGVNYYGDWLQIQMPNKIRLVRYTLDQAPVLTQQLNSTPLKFYVFGSIDSGTTWTLIDAQDVPVYTTQTFTVPSANAITTYDWFRLSVNKIPPSSTTLRVAKWILNGSADNYATGSATDFYADRLGNLLTAPVTGQSLVSWLAGGTGYVTTWYDQSGRGNHATQATAANQPKIDLVNKQIDFKPSAYFDLPNGTVPFGNSNYTMIVKHNTINTTWAGIIGSGTYGTQNATNAIETNTTYTNYWWSNDMSGGAYAQGSIISAKYDNTIGRTLYVNGTSVATNANKNRNSTNIQNTIGTDLRGNQGQGGGNRYLNGELYYVFLFGTALSDTDRTLVESLPVN
jgi:hypothetical protein